MNIVDRINAYLEKTGTKMNEEIDLLFEARDELARHNENKIRHERVFVMAIKHCPRNHHDWPELKELAKALYPLPEPPK